MVYSLDFREKALEVKKKEKLTFEEGAKRFGIGKATLVRWSKDIMPKTTRYKPCLKMDWQALKKDVEDHPDAYLKERAERFGVSSSGVRYALKRLKITYKKNSLSSQSRRSKTI